MQLSPDAYIVECGVFRARAAPKPESTVSPARHDARSHEPTYGSASMARVLRPLAYPNIGAPAPACGVWCRTQAGVVSPRASAPVDPEGQQLAFRLNKIELGN